VPWPRFAAVLLRTSVTLPLAERSAVTAIRCFLVAGFLVPAILSTSRGDEAQWQAVETADLSAGDLCVLFLDNSQSPRVLSGADSLFNVRHAPEFDAFDPDTPGASAGLNFEHIIAGHASPNNRFTPRHGRYVLKRHLSAPSLRLVRETSDDPWLMSSTLTYTLVAPDSIDIDFRCRAHEPALFGKRGYGLLFFANYMNDMEQIALNFPGIEKLGEKEHWIAADAPAGHRDYNGGGTYRAADAPALEYDADHDFKLNLWSYDSPRFTRGVYFGRAAHGMALVMMFDRTYTERDEIRFSLFKFKVAKFPRPAMDWQYVIHKVEPDQEYGFRARLTWTKFLSPEDCLAEYQRWLAGLPGRR
jgi:hypothetical protein